MGLGRALRLVTSGQTHLATHARTFSEVGEGELLVFQDASRRLALGCNRGSAAARLGLGGGDQVRIEAAPA
jgi:S-adenosylmethionine hydrolase